MVAEIAMKSMDYEGISPITAAVVLGAFLKALARILPFDCSGITFVRSVLANSGSKEGQSWRR
jgi:hypothetical protein